MTEYARFTLLTNISNVVHKGIRLRAHAIVIAQGPSSRAPQRQRQQVRLFGPSSAWPICDIDVPLVPYSLTEQALPADFPKDHVLVWRRYDLSFGKPAHALGADSPAANSQTFEITTNLMEGQPIDVLEFPPGASITEVWEELEARVIQAWGAPYFPTLAWKSIQSVAALATRKRFFRTRDL